MGTFLFSLDKSRFLTLFMGSPCATLMLLSRFSHTSFLPAVNQASAAVRVQPDALGPKAIQYMVLYYLTQLRFHRYSSSNLCSPFPATDSTGSGKFRFRGMGIYLVNKSAGSTNRRRATDNWPLPLPRSPRCLN